MNRDSHTLSREEIIHQMEKIANSEVFKSEKNQQLLTFLTHKTLEKEPPKEATIALEFFKDDLNEKDTSYVRVAVYHLRNKLKEYYLTEGKDDRIRLSLEKGSYQVKWEKTTLSNKLSFTNSKGLWIVTSALLFIIVSILGVKTLFHNNQGDIKTEAFFYQDLTGNDKPVLLVLGDLFMYVEEDGTLVRQYNINKLEELAEQRPELLNLNQSRSKILTRLHAISIFNISSLLNDLDKEVNFRMASELSIEDLKENNIIYIGLFKSLYLLDSYYKISNYRPGPGMSYLINKERKDTVSIVGNPAEMHKDFGILSRMRGLENNVIYLMGGFTDTSVEMISSSIVREDFFETTIADKFLDKKLPENFEVLFEVDGYDRKEVSSMTIIEAHELQNISGMWN